MSSSTFIALLRGIDAEDRNPIPMAELRSLASGQSGNVIFRMPGPPEAAAESGIELEAGSVAVPAAELERAIGKRFGFSVPVSCARP